MRLKQYEKTYGIMESDNILSKDTTSIPRLRELIW